MNSSLIFYFFVFVSLHVVLGLETVQSQNCEERQAQAEKLLITVLRVERSNDKSISTDEGFSEYCGRAKQGLILFKGYGKCLSGISKQIYSILKSTATKALRNHCVVNQKASKEYLSCFRDQSLADNYRRCLLQFGESLNYAADMAEDEDIFASLCCGFNKLSGCLDETFTSNGACTDPKINLRSYSKTLFKNIFGSVTDAFCSGYTTQYCTESMGRMDEYIAENKNTVSSFSPVKNLIKLSEKLSS